MLTKTDLLEALKPIHKKLDDLEAGQKRIEKHLEKHIEDTSDFFNQTWSSNDKVRQTLDKRIKRVEDHLDLSH